MRRREFCDQTLVMPRIRFITSQLITSCHLPGAPSRCRGCLPRYSERKRRPPSGSMIASKLVGAPLIE
jgi:hypothetical protein